MPFSILPIILILVAMAAAIYGIARAYLENKAYPGAYFVFISIGILLGPLFISGAIICILWIGSICGLPSWQFNLSRALASGTSAWGTFIVIPLPTFSKQSLKWLEVANSNGSAAAKYAIGNKIYMSNKDFKEEHRVKLTNKGEALMQEAKLDGYNPNVATDDYEFHVFLFRPMINI